MLRINPNITFGQNQITQKQRARTTAPKLERTHKCDCVSFNGKGDLAKRYIEKARRLTLNDDLMEPICPERLFFELPLNFFFAMQNTPNRHIVERMPEGLKNCGLSTEDTLKTIDKIANLARITSGDIKFKSFKIGDKKFATQPCGKGHRGKVLQIKTPDGDLALKIFEQPRFQDLDAEGHGLWAETAIAREFNRAKISNTAELYLASPNQNTGWMMTEFISQKTPKREGTTYMEFALSHFLKSDDEGYKPNYIRNSRGELILVDFGGFRYFDQKVPEEIITAIRKQEEQQRVKFEPPPEADFRTRLLGLIQSKKKEAPKQTLATPLSDEGIKLKLLADFINLNPAYRLSAAQTQPTEIKDALNSPEGRLAKAIANYYERKSLKESEYERLLRAIDVVDDFEIAREP